MIKGIILSVLIYTGLFTPPNPLIIKGIDPGGMIGTYIQWYERVADTHSKVVVDGSCISACTLIFGIVPKDDVCITDQASFGLHAASEDGVHPDQEVTDIMVQTYYPQFIRDWIAKHVKGGKLSSLDLTFMYPSDLIGFYKKCTPDEYPTNNDHGS